MKNERNFIFRSELKDLPESRSIHVSNKNFYFDLGLNDRGVFLRVSQVKKEN